MYGMDRYPSGGIHHKASYCITIIIIISRPVQIAAMPVLFLLSGPKMGFAPQGRRVALTNVKFGMGSRPAGQKCGNTAPKTVKISNFGNKFVPQG